MVRFKFIILLFLMVAAIVHLKLDAQDLINTDSINAVLSKIKEPNKKVDAILDYLGQPENQYLGNVLDLANRALTISEQTNYTKGKINAMIWLGHEYIKKNEYKKAMEYAEKANEIASDFNLDKEIANSQRLLGEMYSVLGDNDNSSRYFFNSLEISERLNDNEGIARSLGSIGVNFFDQQYYKKSLVYYNQALEIAERINNQPLIKKLYNKYKIENIRFR